MRRENGMLPRLKAYRRRYGGGVKTKTIDAMAAGIPVVTTLEGIHGLRNLPDDCIGVGKSPAEIVDQVLLLMKDHSLRLKRSYAGKKYVDKEYSFETFSDRVYNVYLKLS